MSILTPIPPALPRVQRAFFSVPVIGWLARDVLYGDHDNVYYLLVILITLLFGAVSLWGLPALVFAALATVPVYFLVLIIIAAP